MVEKKREMIRLSKPWFPPGTLEKLKEVLDSGWVASGRLAREFAQRVANIEGYRYGVATNSCTSALQAALEVYPLQCHRIRIPHITFPATANACLAAGYEPFITDGDFDMGVDLFGLKQGDRNWAIGDCACSLGSKANIDPEVACYSFHARKTISTGEGGAICTDNKILAERAAELVSHGMPSMRYGYNMRMSDIQAVIGLEQLKELSSSLQKRHLIAQWYNQHLPEKLEVYGQEGDGRDVNTDYNYQCFVVTLPDGSDVDHVIEGLRRRGVESNFGTYRLEKLPAYRDYVDPYAEFEDPNYLALPMYCELERADVEKVCQALKLLVDS